MGRHLLFNIAKGGLVILNSAVDVPGDDSLGVAFLVEGDEAKVSEFGLVVRCLDQRQGLELLAPLERSDELLLGRGNVVIVGPQELLQDDLGRDVVGALKLDSPHLRMADLGENVWQPGIELVKRLLGAGWLLGGHVV